MDLIKKDDEKVDIQSMEQRLKGLLEKLKDPFGIISPEEWGNIEKFTSPENKIKLLIQFYFLERISKSSEFSKILGEAVTKLKTFIPDSKLTFKDIMELVKLLSQIDAVQAEVLVGYLQGQKENMGDKGKTNINISQQQLNAVVDNKFSNIDPVKMGKILNLAEKIIEAAKKD